jgi:restriction endonuclease S subunit
MRELDSSRILLVVEVNAISVKIKRLKDVAKITTGIQEERKRVNDGYKYECIQLSFLGINDVVTKPEIHIRKQKIRDAALIKKRDILVRRISPNYVNVINVEYENTYVTSNVLIIRPDSEVDSQYIAMILEMQGLTILNHFTKRGGTLHSISKKELNEIMIPMISLEQQKKYGELRVLTNKKINLLGTLKNEESKLLKSIFQNLINGGIK